MRKLEDRVTALGAGVALERIGEDIDALIGRTSAKVVIQTIPLATPRQFRCMCASAQSIEPRKGILLTMTRSISFAFAGGRVQASLSTTKKALGNRAFFLPLG